MATVVLSPEGERYTVISIPPGLLMLLRRQLQYINIYDMMICCSVVACISVFWQAGSHHH